jgi:hypothetical protein
MAELAEGARLLSEYRDKISIVGSNPTLSAINRIKFYPVFLYPAELAESRNGGMLSEYRDKISIVGSGDGRIPPCPLGVSPP